MWVHSCGWQVTHPLNGRFLGKFSSVITDDGLSAQQQILGETSHDWSVMSSMMGPLFGSDLNPTPYSCPVTSSIVGPTDDMPWSGPLSTTLPMEVVRVSININPVVSSWMTLLELRLEIPEVVSILMDIMSMDVSHLVCVGSSIPKQATTPAKPWGRLDGHSTTNAFVGGDVGGEGMFGKWAGDLMGIT